ncbi:unnamed protein product [Eruca vesicaria subsp. sativa]|uniref:Uncharacterized protein n=1 Tax=Eruca vesicaria subsp. sativa TaxID=29727 RepID=A0ABC8KNI2_ERUVS|nr:unnamed protein product [Eruca vesicaria subsp. sativa]
MRERMSTHEIVPYEQSHDDTNFMKHGNSSYRDTELQLEGGVRQSKRIASAIVSPALYPSTMEENVTIHSKGVARSLTFSPQTSAFESGGEHVIETLSGMEIKISDEDEMMACEDDLFGEELMELEGQPQSSIAETTSNTKTTKKETKHSHGGYMRNPPLGIRTKKQEFLRQVSPCFK